MAARQRLAAVTIPGKADSAGQQFFIAVVDQPGLDGKYTVFGHVSDGIEIVQKISETPVDDKGVATDRVETPEEVAATMAAEGAEALPLDDRNLYGLNAVARLRNYVDFLNHDYCPR